VKVPSAKSAAVALHLVAEAQKLLEQAELNFPTQMIPQLLRNLADRVEKQTFVNQETNNDENAASTGS
jgi:hypothetical protein